ncbi:hypothetical protein [Salinarchaeum laminariae]|uniref:hypothetical protein n=1 Tax=Salinarchaeum laminariae TaxID=869888 RepID=UPI0020C0CA3C|nr:hypothetical protein [Salinarchaeum laminariae]
MPPADAISSSDSRSTVSGEMLLDEGVSWLARRERLLWIGATVALFADVVTTLLGFRVGLAEGNPVVASAQAAFGVAGFLTIKAGALVLAYGVRVALPQFRVAIPLGIALPWAVVATTNAALLFAAV